MELKTYFAQDKNGNLIPSAVVSIFLTGTTTLATGLKSVTGENLTNPFNADSNGKIQFYAPDGLYDMQVSLGSTSGVKVTFQCLDVEQQLSDANSAADRAEAAAASIESEVTNFKGNDREQWRKQLADVGITLVDGSFEEGAIAENAQDAIWHMASGKCYTWQGATFPKTVAPESTPESTGGVGPGAWTSNDNLTLRSLLAISIGELVNTRYGTLNEYVENTPSILATKYMTVAEYLSVLAGNLAYDVQPKVQLALDEAHRLKCSVFAPAGAYRCDTHLTMWSNVPAFWGDGGAVITRTKGAKFIAGTTNIDPAQDSRKLIRAMGGVYGSQRIHGITVDGNARALTVPKHTDPDQSLPNQTYYTDIEPAEVGPYIYGPDGNTFVDGSSYYNHANKRSGLDIFNVNFMDAPGSCIAGNGRNVRVHGNNFSGWYDHAIYCAGSAFATQGEGILGEDISITGNVVRNRINNRGNGAIKLRFGVNRYAVSNNTIDCVDGCFAFDTGHGLVGSTYAHQPWGQIAVSNNVCTTDGYWMMISTNAGTKWFDTGWLQALVINGNTVQSKDRIFLLGVSGGSADYIMDGYNVQVQGNVFFAPTFMSLYAFQTNTDWKINGNIINITGTAMITGVDQAVVGNSSISIEDNILGVQRTDQVGYMAVSNFERVKVKNNELRNLYLQIGSYTTDLVIDENEVRYHSAIASKPFAQMYSGAGNGLNRASINRNKFKGKVGRCQLKFSSNSQLDAIGNEFDGTSAPFIELHTSGYTPRVVRIDDNIMRGAGVLLGPLAAGVSLGSAASYMEMMKNVMASANSGTQETVTLYQDTGAQSWVSHYQTIRCVKNTFRDALLGVNASGSAQAGLSTANKFWFGENATLNTTVTCNYPAANKANTDITQTVSV